MTTERIVMAPSKLGAEALQHQQGGTAVVTFPRLADSKVLAQGVTTRSGGVSGGNFRSLNISFKVSDDAVRVEENRVLLSKTLGIHLSRAVTVDQVQGDKVLILNANHAQAKKGGSLGEGDGLITKEIGVPILMMVADCLPVFFYDPIHKAIGLAHAGWKGTVSHVAVKTLLAMGEAFGTKPDEARAVLGPCIGPCCYEVGKDVMEQFTEVFPWAMEVLEKRDATHWKLDLAAANAKQLIEMGLNEDHLIRSGLCTVENIDLFYSHRAEASERGATGRIGAFMMLKG